MSSPHIDDRDQSFQYAISLGDFEGGKCVPRHLILFELCNNMKGKDVYPFFSSQKFLSLPVHVMQENCVLRGETITKIRTHLKIMLMW